MLTHDYKRHGTTTLFAALRRAAKTAARSTSEGYCRAAGR